MGFDVEQEQSRPALGLGLMKRAALAIQAQIEISSQPGVGTAIFVEYPTDRKMRPELSDAVC